MNILTQFRYDLSWKMIEETEAPLKAHNLKLIFFVFLNLRSESFHAVFLIRLFLYFSLKKYFKLPMYYFSYRLRRRYGISIYKNVQIGPGLRLPHPYGIILGNGAIIGKMVTIGQYVTVGGNFGLQKANQRMPKIGDWSMLCANSVIAGPINIGEDVIVGACSLITKDIPNHSIVSTSGHLNIKMKDEKYEDSIVRNRYFNFSQSIVNNF